ncbi:hypothetical protein E2C01_099171 [Portunus trituberculatus]|uniref:MULE transposase domain-containing protein n=1 Tax=Portunus trituberculatus TaxID=210409 RepID=A0A5B7K8W4_PORTR|nr:hypothetical protein [Portunus trituberculatus]
MIDLEHATLQAATDAFPTATVNGCFYHLRQNILQKILSEGLQVQYQMNHDVKLQAQMIAAIAFVPLANVENTFESFNELEPIFNYFKDTYIGHSQRRNGHCNLMFPHSM